MNDLSNRHLTELPRVFQAATGAVNTELLRKIFTAIPKASGGIRDLLNNVGGIKLRPKDDPFCQLGIKLLDVDFREKWYRLSDARKRGVPMAFFEVVDTWAHQKHENLGFNSQTLDKLFERRGKKRYPRLELIGILSEQLIGTARHSLTDSALFAWSLIESAQWRSLASPDEDSLIRFRDVLLSDLGERGASELLAQLEDGNFIRNDTEPVDEARFHEPKTIEPTDLVVEEVTETCAEPDSVNQLNKFWQDNIRELEDLVRQAEAEHLHTTAVVKSVLSSLDAGEEFNEAIQSLEKLRGFTRTAQKRATDVANGITDIVAGEMQHLCIDLASITLPKFSISSFEKWKEDAAASHETAREVLCRANTLTTFDEKLIQRVTSDCQEKTIALGNVVQYLTAVETKVTSLYRGIAAKEALLSLLETKQDDFSWNPILDATIPPKSWIDVGEYLAEQGSMPRVLGICARKHYKQLLPSVKAFLDRHAIREDIPLEKTFDVLACMTLGQVEGITGSTDDGRALLAIAELQSFLLVAEDFPTEAYAFLSAKPLSAYVNGHSSTAAERFFRAAHDASFREDDSRLSITELRRLVMFPDLASLSKPKEVEDSLRSNLLRAVEHHGGGGQTHAQLWELAYEVICSPIRALAEEAALGDAADCYRRFSSEFDIEDYLPDWKSTLPERKRKQSQYEKNLRQAVNGKLKELDEWLVAYDLSQRHAEPTVPNDPLDKLKASISEVLSTRDPECNVLRRWFQALSKAPARRPAITTSFTRSLEPNLTEVLHRGYDDVFHPRSFLAEMNGRDVTVSDILADEVFLSFGLYTTEKLAEAYANQKCFEAFYALSAASPAEIPVDIERRFEAAVDDLEAQYLSRIMAIETQLATLDTMNAELISSSVDDIRHWLSSQEWTKAGKELSGVELTLKGIVQKKQEDLVIQSLLLEIKSLGGRVPDIVSLTAVEEAHKKIVRETKPRRKHLDCLKNILAIEALDSIVRNGYQATILALERPENLPSAERSEVVELVFSETIEILRDELLRSNQLIPEYVRKLKFLALSVAKYLKEFGVNDSSKIVNVLLDTEKVWKKIPSGGSAVVDQLLSEFSDRGLVPNAESDVITEDPPALIEHPAPNEPNDEPSQKFHNIFAAYVDRLAAALTSIAAGTASTTLPATGGQGRHDEKLVDAAKLAYRLFKKHDDPRSAAALGHLTDWAISMLKEHEEMLSAEEHAAALHMINRFPGSSSVRALLPTKSVKGRLGEIVIRFLARVARDCGLAVFSNPIEQIQDLSDNIDQLKPRQSLFVVAFSPFGENDSLTARSLWDSYAGGGRQAEARAALMNIFWQSSAPMALACCLKYSPIEIDGRTADALANIANQALSKGRVDLLQSYVDLRRTIRAKPFELFVGLLLSKMPTKSDPPAQLSLVGPLERNNDPNGLKGILSIKPRRSDSPDSITLRLPQTAPVAFDSGVPNKVLKGPFIDEEIFLPVIFRLRDQNAHDFTVLVDCEATSITGVPSVFSIRLEFEILGVDSYSKIPVEEIEEAFQQFPHGQMRGLDYIHRPDDERRIEKSLFESKTIRSLWISSPRRSGKTTMLYRILDAYSHKAGRDNLVAYFSLNKSFDSTEIFNDWLWKTLKNSPDNSELRALIHDFSCLGRDLPHDADVGTFVETIADRLVSTATGKPTRTIFLFDEIDKLATMFFEGGARKDAAIEIAWQLRQLIGRRRDIGFVFAGSSAAKKIFLTNQDAPFFNAGILFELSPFSCDTPEKERYARAIIEPTRIKGRLTIPRVSLERMLWICSGIPYYMKLLAGATYAVAKQSHVLVSDVDEGLHALLEKRTGIPILDEVEGDPGADELRTIALEKGVDRLLTQGVLYSVAELESPLSGRPVRRAHLYGESSPLITRYQLPRQAIERGLDRSIELGLLKLSADSPPKISYAIPILGESIRQSCGSYWAEIDHQLEQLGNDLREDLT